MISIETQARVASIFCKIAEIDKKIEVTKEVLSETEGLDVKQLYLRLD
jgi:hypothetical protein